MNAEARMFLSPECVAMFRSEVERLGALGFKHNELVGFVDYLRPAWVMLRETIREANDELTPALDVVDTMQLEPGQIAVIIANGDLTEFRTLAVDIEPRAWGVN